MTGDCRGMTEPDSDESGLFWTCWLCSAVGGYDHSAENAYAGDVTKLLLADRDYLQHQFRVASDEIAELARAEGHASQASQGLGPGSGGSLSLKDLIRGHGLEHLRGCVMGFAVVKIHSFFNDAMQSLSPEAGITRLGFICLLFNVACVAWFGNFTF